MHRSTLWIRRALDWIIIDQEDPVRHLIPPGSVLQILQVLAEQWLVHVGDPPLGAPLLIPNKGEVVCPMAESLGDERVEVVLHHGGPDRHLHTPCQLLE
eukprot:CAMPEP_0115171954 /NCGR_PEP_ID=MMETSP0270-20121206/2567_1 /TAXON_ID=71861 /ORGANISM="Scrippsiella trochoidea, Strain CCMP3099" /LENGTH=98 /DNA_ID=CAMNT_0002584733 /DNA_START=525 /DNA_END=821 /DNA_ORIENTATION=-